MSCSIVVQPAPQTSALGTKVIIYHTQVSSNQAHGRMCSMWYRYQRLRNEEFLHFTVSTKILQMNLRSGVWRVNTNTIYSSTNCTFEQVV